MGDALVIVIVLAAAILALWWIARSRTRMAKKSIEEEKPTEELPDVTRPTPRVADFHVQGSEALVSFAVPLPEGEIDEVLRDLLVQEAVEVVREKRHSLPLSEVNKVVALAASDGDPVRVGEVELEEPGVLPPPTTVPSLLTLSHIGFDPLSERLDEELVTPPGLAAKDRADELGAIGAELRLPTAVDVGLRTVGVDPETMSAGELVTSTLELFDYRISPAGDGTFVAEKAGIKTFIRVVPHHSGDYPELDSETIQRFVIEAQTSGSSRALLVTEKYAPFEVYEREQRDPRVRFITRERLQKFIDAMALG
ncbi:MAG: hypothetical protein ACE5MI_05795 [Acidimicrobiia bacterium]